MRSLVVLFVVAASARAHADELLARPLVLAPERVEARLVAEVELQRGSAANPLAFAPDFWVGVTPEITVGIVHSNLDLGRYVAGASVCVRERCAHSYGNAGIDVRYGLRDGALAIAPRARVLVRDIDPVKPAVTVGALVRWTRGRIAITTDPYLRLGLANRDQGNRAALVVPVAFAIQPVRRWAVSLHTGYDADLAVWHDGFRIPVALGVRTQATGELELGIVAGYPSLLGPQIAIARRVAFVVASWRR